MRGWLGCLLVLAALGTSAWAQTFPSKVITLVVPASPGGVTDLIARGPDTGLPVLAATASATAAAELAELANVVVAHRTDDPAAARRLAEAAGAADPLLPPGGLTGDGNPGGPQGPGTPGDPGSAAAAGYLPALRDGEFLLTVKNPRRLVPRACAVRARIPQRARGSGTAGGQRAWEGT